MLKLRTEQMSPELRTVFNRTLAEIPAEPEPDTEQTFIPNVDVHNALTEQANTRAVCQNTKLWEPEQATTDDPRVAEQERAELDAEQAYTEDDDYDAEFEDDGHWFSIPDSEFAHDDHRGDDGQTIIDRITADENPSYLNEE